MTTDNCQAVDALNLRKYRLIAVVRRLVRPIDGEIEVRALNLRQGRELDVELGQMGPSDLFVELLGEHVNAEWECLGVCPESNLGKDLVGKRA